MRCQSRPSATISPLGDWDDEWTRNYVLRLVKEPEFSEAEKLCGRPSPDGTFRYETAKIIYDHLIRLEARDQHHKAARALAAFENALAAIDGFDRLTYDFIDATLCERYVTTGYESDREGLEPSLHLLRDMLSCAHAAVEDLAGSKRYRGEHDGPEDELVGDVISLFESNEQQRTGSRPSDAMPRQARLLTIICGAARRHPTERRRHQSTHRIKKRVVSRRRAREERTGRAVEALQRAINAVRARPLRRTELLESLGQLEKIFPWASYWWAPSEFIAKLQSSCRPLDAADRDRCERIARELAGARPHMRTLLEWAEPGLWTTHPWFESSQDRGQD